MRQGISCILVGGVVRRQEAIQMPIREIVRSHPEEEGTCVCVLVCKCLHELLFSIKSRYRTVCMVCYHLL